MIEVVVEPLARDHDRSSFDCGQPELNDFIKAKASQHGRLNISTTLVAVQNGSKLVLGFITFAPSTVMRESLDPSFQKYPYSALPVLLIGRFGTRLDYQKKGIGTLLMQNAFMEAVRQSGCVAIELDSKPGALSYYHKLGFKQICQIENKLHLPINSVKAAIKVNDK